MCVCVCVCVCVCLFVCVCIEVKMPIAFLLKHTTSRQRIGYALETKNESLLT